ncbi:TPA: P-type conjugative transfer protein TrbL [Pseudomonas aeruginosa]|uniref:P-type conjugative transfer protein TrbL n=1 Tax=Pseudomonas aeruginosa TaxID=287 RepID=UPI0021E7AF1D|nr:P-type conjugative transfer protein TrbL [Pseudomonas aeruginosa]MCV3903024.1 P-type conjugative transfer protein TrbL [Pseudomonas aeruginosa]HBN9664645.1 P-type conjugative transfer protein TrbL [Pseudomonas aeruginosa]HCE6886227.1 P-type conjugative transfer protein TrbL [Pseudomonas aeruginosa]
MNDVTIIDRFLDTFSRYIDSGFGLLQGEVAFLTATLIVIDMTIAGLYWAMSHATGQGEDVIAKLLRKVLYVGAFAYIIGNFNWLAGIVFRSFAGLGLTATGSAITMENFLQPGRLAKTGIDAGAPILEQIGDMAGFPEVFVNIDPIVVMFLAWLVVILCFFVLAVQLFITLIEFKLTTLAGFVLVPFALWNKTSFLAENVLGNVVSSGVKVLVLAVIVGIGSGLFAEFQTVPDEPSIDHALVVMLASLALLALGIFGPGIATGLVSGAPQLGAGAMAGAAVGAVGTGVAIGAAATGVGGAVAAGARMAPAAAKLAGNGARAAASTAGSARSAFQAGSAAAGSGAKGAMAGLGNVAKTGAQAAGQKAAGARSLKDRTAAAFRADGAAPASGGGTAATSASAAQGSAAEGDAPATAGQKQPAWAKRLHRRQQVTHAATTTAHTLRGGDGGGSGQGPSLRDSDS